MPRQVLKHFKKHDSVLHEAILAFPGELREGPETKRDLFASLCRIIIGQQLSGRAAHAIYEKFRLLFPRKTPSAVRILKLSDQQLRESGLSYAKVRALRDLSEKVTSRTVRLSALRTAHPDDARAILMQIRGIGPWSCEMLLMFSLGHEDIFAPGDLGLQKGIQKIYALNTLPNTEYILALSAKWSPYRTYAACALWSILDNQ